MKEWRVVSKNRRGTFKVFGTDEEAARVFIEPRLCVINGREFVKRGGTLGNDVDGSYALQSRPYGSGDDSTWTTERFKEEL